MTEEEKILLAKQKGWLDGVELDKRQFWFNDMTHCFDESADQTKPICPVDRDMLIKAQPPDRLGRLQGEYKNNPAIKTQVYSLPEQINSVKQLQMRIKSAADSQDKAKKMMEDQFQQKTQQLLKEEQDIGHVKLLSLNNQVSQQICHMMQAIKLESHEQVPNSDVNIKRIDLFKAADNEVHKSISTGL